MSEAIAAELTAAGIPRVEVLPNVVDADEVRALAAPAPPFALPDRFLLFIGKLEENKGARLLVPAVAAAKTGLPLVVLGEGTLAHALKFDAAEAGVPLQLRGWTAREDVLGALARATVLVFPSLWPEPLSRVLLEALALGTPVAAMDTGGTREILEDGQSGLVVADTTRLAEAVARLAGDEGLRTRLAHGARVRAAAFSPPRCSRATSVFSRPAVRWRCSAAARIPQRTGGWNAPSFDLAGICRRAAGGRRFFTRRRALATLPARSSPWPKARRKARSRGAGPHGRYPRFSARMAAQWRSG